MSTTKLSHRSLDGRAELESELVERIAVLLAAAWRRKYDPTSERPVSGDDGIGQSRELSAVGAR